MRRPSNSSIVCAVALFCPIVLLLPGCEDSQAAGERAAGEKIREAIAQSQKALPDGIFPTDEEPALAAAAELRRIAAGIASIDGASPGQRSAALLLASGINRQASALDLMIANQIEGIHRLERVAVYRAAGAAFNLESLAAPLERVDFASSRTMLKGQRDQAEAQLRQLQTEIKTLESALAQVDRRLEVTEEEARRLDLEADQLRLEAQALRPRQALPFVEQAADLQRRNATLRGELGRQQSERGALAPQLAGAQALGQGGESMVEVTDSAIKNLLALSEKAREAATQAKRDASEIRAAAKTRLEAVLAVMTDSLEARYSAGLEGLERGATQASQAATGTDPDGADSAKIAQAAAQMALGRALWQRASALEDHAALLRRLDAAGGWGQSSQLTAAIGQTETSQREAIAKAREVYGAAAESLGQLRTPQRVNSPEVAGLRTKAERSLAELEKPGSTDGLDDATAGGGAASVEALIARLSTPPASADDLNGVIALMHSQKNPQLVEMLSGLMLAMEPAMSASARKFGTTVDMGGSVGMSMPTGATLVSEEPEMAIIAVTSTKGTQETRLIKVDGRWFIDLDDMMEKAAPGQAQMLTAMAPMLDTMTKAMAAAAQSIAARIDADEFPTPADAGAALQQEIAKAMAAMMGGMGGAGAPPAEPPSSP